MLFTILKYEIKYWLKQPITYIYFAVLLLLSFISMAGTAEAFDEHSPVNPSTMLANSSWRINDMIHLIIKLVVFLLPSIIGASVFRDYKSNVHTVLYAYPFSKRDYLLGKFISSFLVMSVIVVAVPLGTYLGTNVPSVNPALLVEFELGAYLQTYFIYLLPNILIFSLLVFAVVVFTRNVYSGFVAVVLLLGLQAMLGAMLGGIDNRFWTALFDPLGKNASLFYLEKWAKVDLNTQLVPVQGVVIYNRLLWLALGSVCWAWMYRLFSFTQTKFSFYGKKGKGERFVKNNFGSITKVDLPKVNFDYSFFQQIKTMWTLSNIEFKFIVKNWMFVSLVFGGIVFVLLQQLQMDPIYGFKTLPLTWRMLQIPALLFSGAILVLTYLFAGMLVHRERMARANQLVDIAPLPSWTFLMSKFLALVKMQILLLLLILIGGVATQTIQGFYHYEIGKYLFRLYVVMLPGFIAWAMASLFIQTLFTNAYLGFFILLLSSIGATLVPEQLGLNHEIFKFGSTPEYTYSDLNGYGNSLKVYLLFRLYWIVFGGVLLFGSLLLWVRGIPYSFKERLSIAAARFQGRTAMGMLILFASFLSLGFGIYYQDQWSGGDPLINFNLEKVALENERQYKKYKNTPQPEIDAINIHLDIFPKTQDFKARGKYTLINKTDQPIDTLLVRYSFDELVKYEIEVPNELIKNDTILRYGLHRLENPLASGDSLIMNFEVWNHPQTLFHQHSEILENGTFIWSSIFPQLGYRNAEINNVEKRKKYGLPSKDNTMALPSDSTALFHENLHWIHRFEATVSTSADQIGIAPGYLQKEWNENGRRFFHYKMNAKMKNVYAFNSARYEVKREMWEGKSLEIYYHKDHDYNIDRMMKGLKAAFSYCTENYGEYQHEQARIIEFPITYGDFNTVFANSVPFSEGTFIVDVDDEDEDVIDLPFKVAAHEIAHQWWGHQFIQANVKGQAIMTESMAEYIATQVLEREYGTEKKRKYLKYSMDSYFRGRRKESVGEQPLIYAESNQRYLNYRKGEVAMCALSDFLGERKFNEALRDYLEKIKFQDEETTTAIEMIDFFKAVTPDSLQYVIHDMFETITLYNNRITDSKVTQLENGKFQIDMNLMISKYRTDGIGERSYQDEEGNSIRFEEEQSLPLADYLEVGVFGENEKVLYLQKMKFSEINNSLSLIVDEQPLRVEIDPYGKMIDAEFGDNYFEIR